VDGSSDPTTCVTAKTLSSIQRIEVWAEGADSQIRLEIHSIYAEGPVPLNALTPAPVPGKPLESLGSGNWNISAACSSLCQPDPDFSRTDYCKHKDRGGCCVEVNPSWDKVPGYKHMADFCDKLCMPDGPGKLAMCEPPKEFEHWSATDPRDAIDKFYEENPSQCNDRINPKAWVEAYCKEDHSTLLSPSNNDEAFCKRVADQNGCCIACGYKWDAAAAKCVTHEEPKSAYCKSLLEPAHRGCCRFCVYRWQGGQCIHGMEV
jgi:hypothetical protein